MSQSQIVDARGLSCPQPAMLARQALLKAKKGSIEILVDTTTAMENVSRVARNSGWTVEVERRAQENYRLVLKK
jgi:tRNA 2-thiouridine synthesizing protein A